MFKELIPILEKVDINITLSSADGKTITFAIMPRLKQGKDLNIIPLVGSGTAEELEVKLPEIIKEGIGKNIGTISNIAEFTKTADAKSKSTAKSTGSTTSNQAKIEEKPAAPKKFDGSKLSGEPKKAYDSIVKNMERARKADVEVDMLDFLEKSCLKSQTSIPDSDLLKTEIETLFKEVRDKKATDKGETKEDEGLFSKDAETSAETQPPASTGETKETTTKRHRRSKEEIEADKKKEAEEKAKSKTTVVETPPADVTDDDTYEDTDDDDDDEKEDTLPFTEDEDNVNEDEEEDLW